MITLLVVDDTRSVHSYLRVLLQELLSVKVVDVFDGEEAVQLLRAKPQVDLILLDWEMPKLNGPETLKALKVLGIDIPVIMMTTKNSPEEIKQMLDLGVAEYLLKPFTKDILIEKMETALGGELAYES